MDVRAGDESVDEDEEAVLALFLHQLQSFLHALQRRRLVGKRTSRRHPGLRTGTKGNKQRHFAEALHRISLWCRRPAADLPRDRFRASLPYASQTVQSRL